MRVLQVIPYFVPAYAFGGPVRVCYQISKELVRRGNEVDVLTSDAKTLNSRLKLPSVTNMNGINVYYCRNLSFVLTKLSSLLITLDMASFIRDKKKYDIIHIHEYRTFQNIVIYEYAVKSETPYVLQAHGSVLRDNKFLRKIIYDVAFGKRILGKASKVIALTEAEVREYGQVGVPKEKICIIPNGLDLEQFKKLPDEGLFKKKFGVKCDEKVILYMGRVNKTKGIDFLIRSFAYLIKNLENCKRKRKQK